MIAEIVSTGDEIRCGSVIDTNAAYIAEKLEQFGIYVSRHNCVGDDMDELVSVFKEISQRADIAIVSGGLGPTDDDLTREAAAKAGSAELVYDKNAISRIENYFKSHKRKMTNSNKKQAMLPKDSIILNNYAGTAPGFIFKIGKCYFCCIPGVPFEMQKMLQKQVLPQIKKLTGIKEKFYSVKAISAFGLGESEAGELVADLSDRFKEIKIGLRAIFPEVHIKLYCAGKNKELIDKSCRELTGLIVKQLGSKVLSTCGESIERVVSRLLIEKKATIAAAESCTGGLISNMLTNIPGSSGYFLFSGVTYSNQAKVDVLGVSPETIEKYGAVHEQTAKEMAAGAKRIAGADYGISTSGIAGPDGGTAEKPVGTVCIGIAGPDIYESQRFNFSFPDRLMNKTIFAAAALDLLRKKLK